MVIDEYEFMWCRRVIKKKMKTGSLNLDNVTRGLKVYTVKEAFQGEYAPLTVGYEDKEAWMLASVVNDMNRGNIKFCIVQRSLDQNVLELWRTKQGMLN